jgi:UDP-glucose 6-dehydrogenase
MDAMKTVFSDIGYDPDPQQVVDKSEAVVILNDWDDFKSLDLDRVFVVDARPGKSK